MAESGYTPITSTDWSVQRRRSVFTARYELNTLYMKLKLYFVRFCLFVPYTNPHFWTNLNQNLHTSPPSSGMTVGYVWSENVWLFSTFFTFFIGSECRILGTTWLPAQDTSATALYPWFLRVLVWRHIAADDTCPESSATALYPWFLQVLVWRHGNDVVAGDTCAFLLEVSCTMGNA